MKYWIPFLLLSCAGPQATPIKTADGQDGYQLPYCLNSGDCYRLAKETCAKQGRHYDIVDWTGATPKTFICK